MKLLSEACDYGLRAVIWIAQRPDEPQKVKDIAEGIKAAPGYLIKVLQELTKAGILSARRGSQGGFLLRRDPTVLTALDVINAIDPLERIETCPVDIESHLSGLCPMHRCIDDAMARIEETFRCTTIADVIASFPTAETFCKAMAPPRSATTAGSGGSSRARP
ncbi:RrF2 family transcriptional regulator [Novipirellula artificiosorum]|uniref:HTH-type transcriptional regulator CymR n=1 Tax=Novipirellula artificiosorum TaxID=2528016 RepID=A0A5C6DII7_9BACT|nr:Rrf2 family transcriptional regulator [Novipirellula artificiosorum]TWU36015.1 HTH-type transcriptional regulator CymR [Novipirellula artificiosorum]